MQRYRDEVRRLQEVAVAADKKCNIAESRRQNVEDMLFAAREKVRLLV